MLNLMMGACAIVCLCLTIYWRRLMLRHFDSVSKILDKLERLARKE